MSFFSIISICLSALGGLFAGFLGYKYSLSKKAIAYQKKISNIKQTQEDIIKQTQNKKNQILQEAKQKSKLIIEQGEDKAEYIRSKALKEFERNQERIEKRENKLHEKEEKLDKRKEELEKQKEIIQKQELQVQHYIEEQEQKLSQIASLSKQEAKEELFNMIEIQQHKEITNFLEKFRTIKKEEANKEANKIIARVMPRIAADSVSEYTSELIDIPDESFKGKLIGREGRNISYREKITGVELIIDDTPGVVRISCSEHEKRFLASTTLKRLIKDGRINPFYIEKFYNETNENFEDIVLEKGKEALNRLNIPMMNPDIVQLIGKFFFRYSYGQNLRHHSIEVARISEGLASEMGEDPLLAKKAGLLHDIGKVIAQNGQSHTAIGADTLRKYDMHPAIINTAESHHYDVPMTHPISWIVTTADGMSASRPGARFNTKDLFIEKMRDLEALIMSIAGIRKVHIMQAGREIMVYVNPQKILDKQVEGLIKRIGKKIEDQLDYPGIIRMVVFREHKVVEYLR